ncbi:MAG: enoyl-CoA hydratase/isomerase family protein [Pseudomonadales bacterium]
MSDSVILTSKLTTSSNTSVVELTLNSAKTLNALTQQMVEELHQALSMCERDESVVAVIIKGAGDRALCAGGDIKNLRELSLNGDQGREFFAKEYALDYAIHSFSKPLVVWGSGIVMGGGLGLLAEAPFRVVTSSTRIAMPEITIGLYPDVGGSYFLSRAPGKLGLFMGLTGCSINGTDAVGVGLADYRLDDTQYAELTEAMLMLNWEQPRRQLSELLAQLASAASSLTPRLLAYREDIDVLCASNDIAEIDQALRCYEGIEFIESAAKKYRSGCPLTACLVWEQMHRAGEMSLAEVFRMEWWMSVRCLQQPDFAEGVRALVIDKDQSPTWQHASISAVSPTLIDSFFACTEDNPLASLGE